MNIVKERKRLGVTCPACRHPDYSMTPIIEGETIKPTFTCRKCRYSWCAGYDGGKYAELAERREGGDD